jgi:hypothetical protein
MKHDSITAHDVVKLTKARSLGPNQWVADCPLHSDRQTLLIGENNGRLLMHCKQCDFLTLLFAFKSRLQAMSEGAPDHETHSQL